MPQGIKTTLDFLNVGTIKNLPDGVDPQDAATVAQLATGSGTAVWGGITGSISDQTDLINGGKILVSLLPAIAITDTFVVASEAAMLALTAETGDICVRTDETKTYILKGTDPSVLADWELLLTPTGGVVSVFGRTGAVTAQSGDYTFAQIGSTPTTLAGYGITDAYPLTGNPSGFLTTISFSSVTGTASPTQGGTGLTSYAKGDVMVATGTNVLGVVSASTTDGYVFTWDAASGLPMWKAAAGGSSLPDMTGQNGKILTTNGTTAFWGTAVPGIWSVNGVNLYYNAGYVGVGTSTPDSQFTVRSDSVVGTLNLYSNDIYGILLANKAGNISPALILESLNSSLAYRYRMLNQSSSSGNANLYIQGSYNGANYSNLLTLSSAGGLITSTLSANLLTVSGITMTQTNGLSSTSSLQGNVANATYNYNYFRLGNGISAGGAGTILNATLYLANPNINYISTATGVVKGYYFNPTIQALGGASIVAFQSEIGDSLFGTTSGSVGIGAISTINASAILQITSTTKGFLPPRMSLTNWNSIATKAEGLQAWNNTDHGQLWCDGSGTTMGFRYNRSTSKFQGFDGTNWIDLN